MRLKSLCWWRMDFLFFIWADGYQATDVYYRWNSRNSTGDVVYIAEDLEMPQFTITKVELEEKTNIYNIGTIMKLIIIIIHLNTFSFLIGLNIPVSFWPNLEDDVIHRAADILLSELASCNNCHSMLTNCKANRIVFSSLDATVKEWVSHKSLCWNKASTRCACYCCESPCEQHSNLWVFCGFLSVLPLHSGVTILIYVFQGNLENMFSSVIIT